MPRALKPLAAACVLLLAGCALAPANPFEAARGDELFARVQPPMTMGEVRALLGPPDETMAFPRSSTVAWDYRYMDTWGYFAVFSVTFDARGAAVGKISWRTNDGGDHQ